LQGERGLFSLIDGPPLGSSLLVAIRNEISAGGPFPILRSAERERYGRPRGGRRESFLFHSDQGDFAMIAFTCPTCQFALTRADKEAGMKIECPSCGQRLKIPHPVQARFGKPARDGRNRPALLAARGAEDGSGRGREDQFDVSVHHWRRSRIGHCLSTDRSATHLRYIDEVTNRSRKEKAMIPLRSYCVVAIVVLCLSVRPSQAQDNKPSPLLTRNRIQLNLAGAELIVAEAKKKAEELRLTVNIAVVDDGGHLLTFARMDGARPASGYTAITKATTAATFRQETGPLPPKGDPDLLLNLSLQNAAASSGGKLTSLKGGVPVVVDGQIIGAVGVGGGTGEQDTEVAKAGITKLLEALKK
jgi:glc operon protein GlcG